MSFQPLFRRFHEAIQLKRFDENAELIEKRNRILERLRTNLAWTFEPFNQGSYEMGTGIKPLNGDYDIDIGIVFDIDYRSFDPVDVKSMVFKAVEKHTAKVEFRRPCITVYYQQAGELLYHVDLAVMAKEPYTNGLRLAVGKEHSARDQREWQPDDRKGFIKAVERKFSGEDAAQFRRVIRYLKRWKDVHFASEGRAAPSGLALTVAAYHWFQPHRSGWTNVEYDDLAATESLVRSIRQGFQRVWSQQSAGYVVRLGLQFPCAPHDDVLARMTDQQMLEFHQRLEKLTGWLADARSSGYTAPLRRAFGDEFPER